METRPPYDAARRVLTSVEMCAGAGGQALGLEGAGFDHTCLVELDKQACETLRINRKDWNVREENLRTFDGRPYYGADLLAGGLPCPPFSKAGKQLGADDERNLFPAAIRLVDEIRPRAIMIENVRGILDAVFADYRALIKSELQKLGYETDWHLFNSMDFGVPQIRQRVVFVALHRSAWEHFSWPMPSFSRPPTVGQTLADLISERGWEGASDWIASANDVAPTIVGGSHKHGGPDLGPTRAKRAWAALGVDGRGIVDEAPAAGFTGMPRLTVRMVARLQGFPDTWQFAGKKTSAYRQVGNAFPPPVAAAVAEQVNQALGSATSGRIYSLSS